MRQQLCLLHELQEIEQNAVVVQEASVSVPLNGAPDPVDHLEHPDDLVFNLAFYVGRLFPRHCEQDVLEVLHVFGELQLPNCFIYFDGGYFAENKKFKFDLVQNLGRNLRAFPPLELP